MREKVDSYIHIAVLFMTSSVLMSVYSCQHATEPYVPTSHVFLQNQTEYSGVRLTIVEADTAIFSASDGSYALPPLSDGQWTLKTDHPYYAEVQTTFVIRNGKPTPKAPGIFLPQEIKFEVTTDKPSYKRGEIVTIKCVAVNLTNHSVMLVSRTMSQDHVIIRRNHLIFMGSFHGIFHAIGRQEFAAKEWKTFTRSWEIYASLEPGLYQVFAFYTDDYDHIMDQTLFIKWIPAIIMVE